MSKSLRSEPRSIRAERRALFPAVRAKRPSPGRHHPASASDVRDALRAFGESAYYGVRLVELRSSPPNHGRLLFAQLGAPGHIVLYDQPSPPWRLGFALGAQERRRLRAAGATIDEAGVVDWPGGTLRSFMLGRVLAHELGHHRLQHERRLRGERGARTRDHEARADAIAASLRRRLR
jgi:hypothetical protein